MRKRMVFVFGPESSGTRGTTRFLIEKCGYWGTDAHIQPLDEFVYDRQPIDSIVPNDIDRIVFRRSIPHASSFEDLNYIDTKFLNAGYKTSWLIVLRDLSEIVRSKVSRQMLGCRQCINLIGYLIKLQVNHLEFIFSHSQHI